MRVLFVNAVCGTGSTGRICVDLAEEFERNGDEVKIAYGRSGIVPEKAQRFGVRIGNSLDVRMHAILTRVFDLHGFGSRRATKKFLRWAEDYAPDLLWLHVVHGYYINIEMLFDWIKKHPEMRVLWTMHDCWAFTGHCAFFTMAQCEQWKGHCSHCIQTSRYPASWGYDNCSRNFERKKKAFTGVPNMKIITPCTWLAELVKKCFLSEYPVDILHNGVDTDTFKPTYGDFTKRYGIEGKKIILGVANVWDERKGLDDFFELADLLDDRYVIVLVGLTQKQLKRCTGKIIGLQRTDNVRQLAELYTAAAVLFNPTYEDNYPTVDLEAISCGTPVVTYDTGGSREIVELYGAGCIIERRDYRQLLRYIESGPEPDIDDRRLISKNYLIKEYFGAELWV